MKNFNDVIQSLIKVNDQLAAGIIDIEKAKVIGQNTQILINAAKVQLEFAKQTNKEAKFFIYEDASNCFDAEKLVKRDDERPLPGAMNF